MSIPLNTASTYGVLAGTSVANTGATVVNGDIGISPGTSLSGFPPGTQTGTQNINNDASTTAISDAMSAFATAVTMPTTQTLSGNIGGQTLVPGVYELTTSATLIGTLTLDGQGSLASTFVFKVNNTLTTGANSIISLINLAGSPRVFWAISNTNSNAVAVTLGLGSHFHGTLVAIFGDIVVGTGALTDALMALGGTITLDTNHVTSFQNYAATGGDPHILCLDGSRLDVYEAGYYRLFDNCNLEHHLVINAEIRRDPFDFWDYYYQLWIRAKGVETLVKFDPEGLLVNSSKIPIPRWEQSYIMDGQCFKLACEPHYNTVLLSTPLSEDGSRVRYSGLVAGQILPLTDLRETSPQTSKVIRSQYYDQNALVAGSVGPHLVTVAKKALYPRDGWYRLLQWRTPASSGLANIYFDDKGQVRELTLRIMDPRQGQSSDLGFDHWSWIGEDHWKLTALKNGLSVGRLFYHEQEIDLGEDRRMLIRVQGNGSVSVAFRRVDSMVRGLVFDDIIEVCGPYDTFIEALADPIPIDPTRPIEAPTPKSIYQRFIDPMAS